MRFLAILGILLFWLTVPAFAGDQEKSLQVPMQPYNIEVAQKVINALGFDATVKEGIIIAPEKERQKGTAVCTFYAQDRDGNWYGFVLKMEEGKIYEFKGGPVKGPKEKKDV